MKNYNSREANGTALALSRQARSPTRNRRGPSRWCGFTKAILEAAHVVDMASDAEKETRGMGGDCNKNKTRGKRQNNKMALPLFLTPQHEPNRAAGKASGARFQASRRESRSLNRLGKGGPGRRGRGLKLRAAVAAAAKTQTSGTVVVLSRWDRPQSVGLWQTRVV